MFQALLIFFLQIIFVPVLTMRTILLVKNQSKAAAGVGLLEATIYIFSVGNVFQDLTNFWNIGAYVLGFGIGLLLGGKLERKLAIGYITYNVSLLDRSEELVNALRAAGFGVTVFVGEGMNSERYRLDVVAKRSREAELLDIIESIAPKAFLSSYEIRSFKGGYLTKAMKNRTAASSKNQTVEK
ncbi:DUF2179 domain-containing protein [Bacillus lacus]|uniref:UPF0316 protein GJU40_19050 n=1 Tax=Metabacillus lacus TaxID=1983721 RepID=A0A7X2J2E7_9BACI|nr:DUF2179 domain-containing protein [Metabacillus lacus]MRX74223.1 DUF2179 domain-containing protein [Metabacillus lacus]